MLSGDTTPPIIQRLAIPDAIEVGTVVDIATAEDDASGPVVVRAYISQEPVVSPSPDDSTLLATAEASAGPVTVSASIPIGRWYVWAQASDPAGNTATVGSDLVSVVDTTAPYLLAPANVTILAWEDSSPTRTGTATATDNSGAAPTVGFSDVIDVESEATHITRTWTAIDESLNQSSAVQVITVVTNPVQLVLNLGQQVQDMRLSAGTTQSLDAKLDAALSSLQSGNVHAAENQLHAFVHYVEAQRGEKLTDEQADELLAAANALLGLLDPYDSFGAARNAAFAQLGTALPR